MIVTYLTFCLIIFNYVSALDSNIHLKEILGNITSKSDCIIHLLQNVYYLDAWSHLPSGILVGNSVDFGNFDECINLFPQDSVTKGKYCLGHMDITFPSEVQKSLELVKSFNPTVKSTSISIKLVQAACFPNVCTLDDMNYIGGLVGTTFDESSICQTYDDVHLPLTRGAKIAIGFFSVVLCIMVVQTLYDLACVFYTKTAPKHPMLIAFSVYTNVSKLLKISKNNNMLGCLNGLKFFSMAWVIYFHQFQTFFDIPILNPLDARDYSDKLKSMSVVSGTLAVDTFLTISGLLMVYNLLKSRAKGTPFGPIQICLYYIHRFIRLTPALGAVTIAYATLYRYFGTGPYWPQVTTVIQDDCQKYWWSTLLYVQNYVNVNNFCIGQSWYLSVDMQLFYISPIIFLLLEKFPKITFGLLGGLSFATMAFSFDASVKYHLAAINTNYHDLVASDVYMPKYYVLTHTRAAPWFIGIAVGYIIFHLQQRTPTFKMNRIVVTVGWIVCWVTLLACFLGGHSTLRNEEYDKYGNAFHIALVRPFWAIGLGWLIIACQFGYGGPINWILSLPIYSMLNRFTYSMYLLHTGLIVYTVFSQKFPGYYSEFDMNYYFWGTFMLTFFASGVWVIAFETPMVAIEKFIFGNVGKKPKVAEK